MLERSMRDLMLVSVCDFVFLGPCSSHPATSQDGWACLTIEDCITPADCRGILRSDSGAAWSCARSAC